MSMYSNCCLTNENIAWIFIAGAADSPVFLLRPAPLFGNFPAAPFRNVITLPSIRFMSSTFRIFNSFCSSELTSFLAFFLNFLFTEYIAWFAMIAAYSVESSTAKRLWNPLLLIFFLSSSKSLYRSRKFSRWYDCSCNGLAPIIETALRINRENVKEPRCLLSALLSRAISSNSEVSFFPPTRILTIFVIFVVTKFPVNDNIVVMAVVLFSCCFL